ncbi:hypothetical protein GCM10022243_48620 [Saccharothrix violaceirubra]|uniref:Uncharacterized protein n=1 Tax=Saccharothrix violaceirubra TaxID=413306 RepID=A0A7W7WU42_9PSEU|nr:hypothetical protein [Saccharothrix violaceirubra]MBB4963796.1 hypothetical protein [Saccharothrix violaceirubra]
MSQSLITVIPQCLRGCDGRHLETPDLGPGECTATRVFGRTPHETNTNPNAVCVSVTRTADPDDGVHAWINLAHVDGEGWHDLTVTADQARTLIAALTAAVDHLDDTRLPDLLIHSTWQ